MTSFREDVMRRAEANMQRRHDGEERDAVRRMIDRDKSIEEAREAFAWRVMISIIMAGCALALALRLFGVER